MKKTLAILLSALMLLSLAACGETQQNNADANLAEEMPPVDQQQEPTPTPEPDPEPVVHEDIVFTGTGDDVLSLDASEYYYCFFITGNEEGRHFSVTTYDSNDDYSELLVNTTEPYSGITYDESLDVQTIEVKAEGAWEIRVMDFGALPDDWSVSAGETFYGSGDLIVFLGSGKTATIVNYAEGHFAVTAYDEYGWYCGLLANEIGPYEGKVKLDSDAAFITVHSGGDWDFTLNP